MSAPTAVAERIETLDVLRGFALLGILLLNILGFGLVSPGYFLPQFAMDGALDLYVWATVDIGAEGAMRALFSMLFGAGVALFTTGERGKGASLHYKRNFWLLAFGLFDAYLLLWTGDVLFLYALVGFILYPMRNASPRRLLIGAIVLIVIMSALYALTQFGMNAGRAAAALESPTPEQQQAAEGWRGFKSGFELSEEALEEELAARRGSYVTAFGWAAAAFNQTLLFVLPFILFWDAFAMMLLGMALYKLGVLQGERSRNFYLRAMVIGFGLGISFNAMEVYRAYGSGFGLLETFPFAQWTYHLGRLGVAIGWMSLLILLVKGDLWRTGRRLLAAVGRMALTNYLSQSLICLFIFTGAGLALVGELSRAQLYLVVLAIWAFQLWFSQWWLTRHRFGPVEWLWRGLTYGSFPDNSKAG